jgi:copper homeostasis protein
LKTKNKILFEVCVDSIESSLIAGQSGADRIELCADLNIGGVTPSYGTIKTVLDRLSIPAHVLIRPRSGGFLYTSPEYDVMKQDILFCKEAGARGIVAGILNRDGTIDRTRLQELINLARPMSVTFHRAFDFTRDAIESLELLIEMGVDRILTSGQETDVYSGINMIKKLVEHSSGRIIIMPGGGVNEQNIREIIKSTGVKEIHASARESVKSKMNFVNPNMSLNNNIEINFGDFSIASGKRVKALSEVIATYNIDSNL